MLFSFIKINLTNINYIPFSKNEDSFSREKSFEFQIIFYSVFLVYNTVMFNNFTAYNQNL